MKHIADFYLSITLRHNTALDNYIVVVNTERKTINLLFILLIEIIKFKNKKFRINNNFLSNNYFLTLFIFYIFQ